MFKIDTHMHTLASGHAYNTIDEMTKEAKDKGMEVICFTEHAPKMPGSCGKFYFNNLKVIPREKYGVKRLFGSEVNIMDRNGKMDLSDGVLKELDIVIASFHTPCIQVSEDVESNTNGIVKIMENPYVDIIGHPDDGRYPIDFETVVKAAIKTNTLLELNNNSLNPLGPRKNTRENDMIMLEYCKKLGACIVIGSDAHVSESIGDFKRAEKLIHEIEFPEELIANSNINILKKYLHKGSLL